MRALRITLIVLLVFGGLFVGADRISVGLVEDRLAEKLKASQGASEAQVSINGFPFLTQVATKELDDVEAKLTGVTTSDGEKALRVSEFELQARNIEVGADFSSGVARTAEGTAYLTYEDLSAAAEEGVTVGWGGAAEEEGEAKVKVTGSIELPLVGREVERSTTSTVSVENGDTVRLHADAIPGSDLPGIEDIVRKKIDYTRKIDGLPAGVKLNGVRATKQGVEITFSGEKVNVTE
ncbi:DUF2993 domain-containing protein [Streptomyces sp. XM4193]|uniref:LmeA family phospholipid-binding protein n=1 Tax=Streptomyces sp. XM4193 TaxID=2929782 RepID=UPI001FFA5620|nr:DUF2993 domain-containing protein [Streptomyces sp. XM4193]MCK1798262.1 DUF2993 domain-containing protein [Streptomyces sp. XM4193]